MKEQLTEDEIEKISDMLKSDDLGIVDLAIALVGQYSHISILLSNAYDFLRSELASVKKDPERVQKLRHIVNEGLGYANFND